MVNYSIPPLAGLTRVNAEVGKSSLTVQFVDGHFVESYYPTIENTFSKVIKFKGQEFATEIVDTAGQVSKLLILSRGVNRDQYSY